ncbi:hypothetical protein Misp02_46190 [Microtetraspora sp. NBRC 16547]|nr:hypothetical protein Misp02_46190 [Microtetraspora sp. NBRC 16547]
MVRIASATRRSEGAQEVQVERGGKEGIGAPRVLAVLAQGVVLNE